MIKLLLIFILLISISCSKQKEEKFQLNGKTDQIENGTVLYLHDLAHNQILDSARVEDGEFSFSKPMPGYPYWVMLHTGDRSKFSEIWIENNKMEFNATGLDFKNAKVTGSKSNTQITELYKNVDFKNRKKLKEKEKNFIQKHPESVISAFILSNNINTWGLQKTRRLFGNFSDRAKNSYYGEKIYKSLQSARTPEIGEKLVEISMKTSEGQTKKLSKVKAKLILLDFWASWCVPCRRENPELVRLYNNYKSRGFEIYAVSLDQNKEQWMSAIKKDNLPWINVSDLQENNKAAKLYGVSSIPDNFLIDQEGKVIARKLPVKELREKLEELFDNH